MKSWALRALPLALLALLLGLRVADPPLLERARNAVFDEYQRLKPRPWSDVNVRIVGIDDQSLERLGQWPWPRTLIAALVDRLGEMGAAAVAFDIVFSEPDRTSPTRILPLWAAASDDPAIAALAKRLPDHDQALAAAIARAPAVLGMMLIDEASPRRPRVKWGVAVSGDDPRPLLPAFAGTLMNLPAIEGAAKGQGVLNGFFERDGIIRHLPVLTRLTGGGAVASEIMPSVGAEALRVAQGATTYVLKSSGASGQTAFGEHTGLNQVRIGDVVVPTDGQGRIWLHDTGFVRQRFVPAWEVLSPGFDPSRIEGKIVFVGATATGLDIRSTPLNLGASGVEAHAQGVEQMILGDFLERPDWITGAEVTWLLALSLALALLLPRWGAAWCAVLAGGGMAAAFLVSWLAFTELQWLVDPIYPAFAALFLYLAQSFVLFLRTEAERRQVRGAFSRYLSPALVERLAQDPASLRLGGETRDMTILFSDIRGFTAISESLDAQSLTRFMNRFLTPMTDIILRRGGTIDKYMGDAIMAFWNAPLDDSRHAANAALAALDMIERLKSLNAEWEAEARTQGRAYRPINVGVGLNTGSACVGNMGSEQRFDYSVLGDTVNLSSRLEGQSKTYGVSIVAGERVRAEAPDFAWFELDLIQVKGKDQAVRIFALLGDQGVATQGWFKAVSAAQGAFLEAYRAGDWARAEAALSVVRQAAEGRLDGLCDLFAERIARQAAHPQPGWDGVYRATEK
jgi:adenylate cyclase